ncbi:MAG TPA: glycosyltransferase [Solirubrobacteraceae bacterium]|jgi:N-acetylglucosaminyl-diphospho-decaprenol L-rhamnosyltransferase|nr:glycosyltransferase [Solirubrobacteraceae bacterium]
MDAEGSAIGDETLPRTPPAAACVDVIIVSADMSEMTLECVTELDDPSVADVIVLDNAFGDDERVGSAREQIAARSHVVALEQRHGFAAANNRGLQRGHARYALLLNSDVLVAAGAIDALRDALEADADAVTAGGRLVDPQTLATQAQYRPRPFPTLANFLVIVLGIEELWPGNPVTRRYHGTVHEDDATTRTVDAQPAAAALLVRRDAIDAIGGFDERFWFWFEDSDLLLRLGRRGQILYVPSAVFRHLGGGSFSRWSKAEQIRSIHHGIVQYADAHFSRARRGVLGLAELAISLPRVVLFGRSRPDEASAWRAVAGAGVALLRGRQPAAIAPGP